MSPEVEDLTLLDEDALADLRWYLEDFLRAPFGAYAERGEGVATRLIEWGRAMFAVVFGTAPEEYELLRASSAPEVVFRSDRPDWLGLPWELLADPTRPTPLALDGVRITRMLASDERAAGIAVADEQPRVLMVIARPDGERDVAFRSIARPMLAAVDHRAEVVVLRPPTLERLAETLIGARVAGRPFHIVHLDCHGELAEEAVLLLEQPGVGAERVRAAQLARVLADARVPVVVLNACQSGAMGSTVEAAVATRLVAGGATAVVAMAYTVYAVAAAEFMTAFYQRLFSGATVAEAVLSGRARMARHPERPSPAGRRPLEDWVIPVHYARAEVRFPDRPGPPASVAEHRALTAVGAFVGRDHEFHRLEASAVTCPVILLHGPAGVGKSELAKAFGRWWRDTSGVRSPEHVVWYSFEPGGPTFGVVGLVTEIGLQVFGPAFASAEDGRRRAMVDQLLRRERLLIILDNFEAVGADDARDGERDRRELQDFLAGLGRSVVLVTSRTDEARLGEVRRIELGGLGPEESAEYTDRLLAPYPDAVRRRSQPAFQQLLDWLDGHPLTMRLVLPHLETTDPDVLLAGLRGMAELPQGYGTGRTGSLAASLSYSSSRLPSHSRRLLTVTALFQGITDADVLVLLSANPDAPERFRHVTADEWVAVLNEATHVGLLVDSGSGTYRLHPALPAYFLGEWRAAAADSFAVEFAAARRALVDAMAVLANWGYEQLLRGEPLWGHAIAHLHRSNLSQALRGALDAGMWAQALHLGLLMNEEWGWSGRTDEADGWTDRVRLAVEDADGEPPRTPAQGSSLWLFFVSAQLNRSPQADPVASEAMYHKVHDVLLDQPESSQRQRQLAVVAGQLGQLCMRAGRHDEALRWFERVLGIAQELGYPHGVASVHQWYGDIAVAKGRWDEAEQWYEKSMSGSREAGDQPGVATSCQSLGKVAWMRQDFDAAERWYREALAVREEMYDQRGTATVLVALGEVAHYRGDFDAAERWYSQALVAREQAGDLLGAAFVCYELGALEQRRQRWDIAEQWYRRSIPAATIAADSSQLGLTHHALGTLAEARGRDVTAEEWYRRALADFTRAGNRIGVASCHGSLGLLAERRGDLAAALEHVVRCVTQFDDFPNPATGPAPGHLRRLVDRLGLAALRGTWLRVAGVDLPETVRRQVTADGDGSPSR
ncbi:tetratricopeptide repeat protein [Verrucosispora sp. WMMD573]|uniref:tetratricopeptide repeat protein n=1 Tax=Verrucosispora sp. WMMD573 TaxID=3015149 RepID=UPI00248ABB97|nr:tetratricopeptide repeat protein [Verrucosispora sp. WMMD573]WBB52006.1 tetratricopeptide repeat protein [Verrucosispora sp. WMMD573]